MKKVLVLLFVLSGMLSVFAGEIVVKDGEKIAFLGDSITQLGAGKRIYMGYLPLVIEGLKEAGVKATMVPAGISGNKSNQMLARVDKDVIAKKPQWMLLSCGVNDVAHGKNGVLLPDYKKNITQIVDKAQAAGIKVVIMTASMIREDAKNKANTALKPYNDFLRELAAEKKCLLADINKEMQQEVASPELSFIKGNKLTYDGVHMNGRGHAMMAEVILKTFGVPEEKVKAMRRNWEEKYPEARLSLPLTKDLNRKLHIKAAEKKMTPEAYVLKLLSEDK